MSVNVWSLSVWLHVLFGITWIGLLYYFNFVQTPAMAAAVADEDGPGPAAIKQYIAPRALRWFRWSALFTWLSGLVTLEAMGVGVLNAFVLQSGARIIGVGAWLGTIMLFNEWVLIWPSQKKILGMVKASDNDIADAQITAALASRSNVVLSVPMLMCMVGQGHGLPI